MHFHEVVLNAFLFHEMVAKAQFEGEVGERLIWDWLDSSLTGAFYEV
jgi:hypothetical protein